MVLCQRTFRTYRDICANVRKLWRGLPVTFEHVRKCSNVRIVSSGGSVMARPKRPVFVACCLQAQKGTEPVRALKAALKTLKRRYGLKCTSIREAPRRRR